MALTTHLTYNKDRVKANGQARVYLRVTIDRESKPINLDFYWPAAKIDEVNDWLLPRYVGDPDVERRNLQIKNKISDITDIETTYSLKKRILTLEFLLRELKLYKKKMTLQEYMTFKLEERFQDGEISEGTKANGLSTVETLTEYKKRVPIEQVNKAFLTKFSNWMDSREKEPGTIWSKIKDIKAYLTEASKEVMLVVDPDYKNFKNTAPQNDVVFLNQRELNILFGLLDDSRLSETQRSVLQAFLFQCTTSLRISDVYRANSDWNYDTRVLQFVPKKNGRRKGSSAKKLVVPIMPGATTFVHNLQGKFFSLPSEQEYNRALKEIGKIARFYKVLTSHVGRHTYAHLFMKYIGNLRALQLILGHSSPNTTQRYAHLESEDLMECVSVMERKINESINKPTVVKRLWPVPHEEENTK